MSQRKIIGVILLVIGVILLVFGYNATQATGEQLAENLTGHYSDQTMVYIIVGAVAAVGGLLMVFTGGRR